jgi:N-acetylmuramic acid 6-phosphate etherase
VRILHEASGAAEADCVAALAEAGGDVSVALVVLLGTADAPQARRALTTAAGSVRGALTLLAVPCPAAERLIRRGG